jgi:hypothetical protein
MKMPNELKNGTEVCSDCNKPRIALLDGKVCKCPYQIVIEHKGGEIATALALANKQLKRTEGKLIACEKALKVYRDRDKEIEDILGREPVSFLQPCKYQSNGSPTICNDSNNHRHNKLCSKRCETPTKGVDKLEVCAACGMPDDECDCNNCFN